MNAIATCPECGEKIERGGRDWPDAKESAAFALADHLKKEHAQERTCDAIMASNLISRET